MKVIRRSAVPVLAAAVIAAAAGDLRFASENIFLSIAQPDTLCVTGEYFFASKSGVRVSTPIVYPIPVDSIHAFPHVISVKQSGKQIPFESLPEDGTIVFSLTFAAKTSPCVTICYRQRLSRPTARYILLSTGTWGEPLQMGYYRIALPAQTRLAFLSYPSDKVSAARDSTVYEFARKNFMPEKDIVVEYSVNTAR
jgi:hypothetical protein